jgi:hypothetical protein
MAAPSGFAGAGAAGADAAGSRFAVSGFAGSAFAGSGGFGSAVRGFTCTLPHSDRRRGAAPCGSGVVLVSEDPVASATGVGS